MEPCLEVCLTVKEAPRKRKRNESLWKKERLKILRYSSPGSPKKLICNHLKKGQTYKCADVTDADQEYFHKNFYAVPEKEAQDSYILKYTEAQKPQKSRLITNERGSNTMAVKYYIGRQAKAKLQVCQQAFLATLLISKGRVQGVVSRHFTLGTIPKERRGGDRRRKKYESRRNAVMEYIKTFKPKCKSKKSTRVYLSSDLNIKKMWQMYDAQAEESLKVNQSYFREVFVSEFNIGFKSKRSTSKA